MTPRDMVQKIAAPSPYWMWAVRLVMFLLPVAIAAASYHTITQIRLAILVNNEALREEMDRKYLSRKDWDAWRKWVYEHEHDGGGG